MAPARPWWMTTLSIFCLGTVVFLVWRDLELPHVRDVEVWFGFEVRGRAARLTAPVHWILFGVGAWAFWTQRTWILPVAAGYAFYVAFSHLLWNVLSPNGYGLLSGAAQAAAFSVPAVVLLIVHARR